MAARRTANSSEGSLALLFAPGAGAPSSSPWMRAFAERFERLGRVVCFDYPYQVAGRRSPDRHDVLVRAHRRAFDALRAEHAGPIALVGKSMGGRIGCHVAVELGVGALAGVVCLGYPLVGQNGKVRDEVLHALITPVLFVQGTRDPLCPLARLEAVRAALRCRNELFVVEGGDHSLRLSATAQRAAGTTQDDVDARVVDAITAFLSAARP